MNAHDLNAPRGVPIRNAILLFVGIMVAALGPECAQASQGIRIELLEQVAVDGPVINLAEIATVAAESDRQLQRLKTIDIGRAPNPGQTRRLDANYVRMRLRQKGFDPSSIDITGAARVMVSRRSVEIESQEIEILVRAYLMETMPWEPERVSIDRIRVTQRVLLPRGGYTYRIVAPKNSDYLGTLTLGVEFRAADDFHKKIWVTARMAVFSEVVVAAKPLKRYQRLTTEDVRIEMMDLSRLSANCITDLDEIVGKRTRRAINAMEILRTDTLELPPLVRRRDVVSIVAESAGLMVTTLGVVKEDGRRGDRVRVENMDSQKAVYARVVDAHTVRVDY